MGILVIVILMLFSAFFSSTETAVTAINKVRLRYLKEKGDKRAILLDKLLKQPRKLIVTILIGNNIVNVAASVLGALEVYSFMETKGLHNVAFVSGITTGVMTFIILMFGEITPKTLAINHAEFLALNFFCFIYICHKILYPLGYVLNKLSTFMIGLFGGKIHPKTKEITEEEIKMMIDVGEEEGVIEEKERDMLQGVFDLSDKVVREIATPRTDMITLEWPFSVDEAMSLIKKEGHSRIPIFEENIDNIVGIIYAKDILGYIQDEKKEDIKEMFRNPVFIPESKKISELLTMMKRGKTHLAIVVDEYGGTHGLVTFEDIIEEIVGEVHDEYEEFEAPLFKKVDETSYILSGKLDLDKACGELEIEVPQEEEYDTIGGFVLGIFDRIPKENESITYMNVVFTVEKMENKRIDRIIAKRTKGLKDKKE